MRRVSPLVGSFLLAALAACGDGSAGRTPVARDDPLAVATRAIDALRAGDLAALVQEMDDEGRRTLAADLEALRPGLGEPADVVPGVVAEVRVAFAADGDRLRTQAVGAGASDLLRFLVRVRPVGGGPEAPPALSGPGRAVFTYRDVHGVARPIEVVRGPRGWRVRSVGL